MWWICLRKLNSTKRRRKVLKRFTNCHNQSCRKSLFRQNFLNEISTLDLLYHFGSSTIYISALLSFPQNQTVFCEVQSETENRYFLFSIILLLTYSDSAQSSSRMAYHFDCIEKIFGELSSR